MTDEVPTPRTDGLKWHDDGDTEVVPIDFARELERETIQLRAANEAKDEDWDKEQAARVRAERSLAKHSAVLVELVAAIDADIYFSDRGWRVQSAVEAGHALHERGEGMSATTGPRFTCAGCAALVGGNETYWYGGQMYHPQCIPQAPSVYPQEAMDKATTTIRQQALFIAELESRAKLLAQENGEAHEVRRQQAERIERLESALRKISTTPNRPFPDPNAHSWDAYHRAVFVAWSSANQMARAALTTVAPEGPKETP